MSFSGVEAALLYASSIPDTLNDLEIGRKKNNYSKREGNNWEYFVSFHPLGWFHCGTVEIFESVTL
jgi:hypothetical protein